MKVFLNCLRLVSIIKTMFFKKETVQLYQQADICGKTSAQHIFRDLKGCLSGVIFPEAKGLESTRAEPPSVSHQLLLEKAHCNKCVQILIFPLIFFLNCGFDLMTNMVMFGYEVWLLLCTFSVKVGPRWQMESN